MSVITPAEVFVRYVDADTGNDTTGDGLTRVTAYKTLDKARTVSAALNFDFTRGVVWYCFGHFRVPIGTSTPYQNTFVDATTPYPLLHFIGESKETTSCLFASRIAPGDFTNTGAGLDEIAFTMPTGITVIDAVEISGVADLADGRRKRFLKSVANVPARDAAPFSYVVTGGKLYINRSTATTGIIEVRYRHTTSFRLFSVRGCGIKFKNWTFRQPLYTNLGFDNYAILFSVPANYNEDYVIEDCDFDGTVWHAYGFIVEANVAELRTIRERRLNFVFEVVSDYASQSCNPVVYYSAGATGTFLLADRIAEDMNFYCYRPQYADGSGAIAAGAGGYNGNNTGQLFFTHGSTANRVTDQENNITRRINVYTWDYQITNPWLPQRNGQAISYTRFDNTVWGGRAEDITITHMLAYDVSQLNSGYGIVGWSQDSSLCCDRYIHYGPSLGVLASVNLRSLYTFVVSGGNTSIYEFREPMVTVAGNPQAFYFNVMQISQQGGTGAAHGVLTVSFGSCIQAGTGLLQSVMWFGCAGSVVMDAIYVYGTLFHSNEKVTPTYNVLAFSTTSTNVPFTGTLFMWDCWYSNFGTNRFDATNTQRDSAAEWQTGANGPGERTIAQSPFDKDCLYTDAGTYDPVTRDFGVSDAARTSTLSPTITVPRIPVMGSNRKLYSAHRGSLQRGAYVPLPSAGNSTNVVKRLQAMHHI